MLLSEWKLADAQKVWKEEGLTQGIAIGEARGIARMKIEFAKTLIFPSCTSLRLFIRDLDKRNSVRRNLRARLHGVKNVP